MPWSSRSRRSASAIASRRRLVQAFGAIAVLFLLISLGGHTPFYRLWYEVMPMMKKVRAPGMAFYLVALPVSVYAAFGVERLLRREVSLRTLMMPVAVLGVLALLGTLGVLESVATLLASPEQAPRVLANASDLKGGGLRLLRGRGPRGRDLLGRLDRQDPRCLGSRGPRGHHGRRPVERGSTGSSTSRHRRPSCSPTTR